MNKKFKVGDKVRIIKDVGFFAEYCFTAEYCFHKGDIVKIIYDYGDGTLKCRRKDGVTHTVLISHIEPLINTKVIFNGNATILLKNGKRYVSKCEDGDTLDREKGLLLCLAKANGVSYRDLQEMLANAEIQISGKKKCKGEKSRTRKL